MVDFIYYDDDIDDETEVVELYECERVLDDEISCD